MQTLDVRNKLLLFIQDAVENDNRFRRFFVLNGKYRVLYLVNNKVYSIAGIYSTKQLIQY